MTFPVLSANGPSGYNLTRSLRFRSSASANLSKTFAASPTVQTKQTLSVWCKRGTLATAQRLMAGYDGVQANGTRLLFQSTDNIEFRFNLSAVLITTAVYRDPSAWYHVLVSIDTTQATAANRLSLYVNGVKITAFGTATYPTQNDVSQFVLNNANNKIGSQDNNTFYFDGYMAEFNFIDGQALTPSSFGSTNSTTGVWQPAAYTGTYGTNGFYLPFTNTTSTTTLGYDSSGNGNNWTTNNFSLTAGSTYDSMTDVPTLTSATAANFCVLNPLDSSSSNTISNANLKVVCAADRTSRTTIGMTSGKFYAEITIDSIGTSSAVGIARQEATLNQYLGYDAYGWSYVQTGVKTTNNSGSAYGSSYTTGDIIGIAFDADAGTLTFYKNNTSQGTAFTGLTSGPYFFAMGANSPTYTANFGQRPFTYTPPSGFVALNTYNLPASAVPNGAAYMAATLYTGNGSTQSVVNTVGNASFQPDFVWAKNRSSVGYHGQFDSVRGTTKWLQSNNTNAESTLSGVTAFNSNGFSLGADYNGSPDSFVAWQWKGGGTAVSNTNGSITSSVSANTTSGFSVVTYTGNATANATVGHGLGVTPNMIIVKVRSSTGGWWTYHVSTGKDAYLDLSATAASASSANYWGTTGPTSSTIQINGGGGVNNSGSTYVAYCFAAIKGFSAFGSYTGNGSTDGPFVYCGFRPRYLLIKRTDSGGGWSIMDTSRSPFNVIGDRLVANDSAAELTGNSSLYTDFLSNGFKSRNAYSDYNASGGTYIYAAFAESPFQNSLAR